MGRNFVRLPLINRYPILDISDISRTLYCRAEKAASFVALCTCSFNKPTLADAAKEFVHKLNSKL